MGSFGTCQIDVKFHNTAPRIHKDKTRPLCASLLFVLLVDLHLVW
jgi:hypothetical protein